MIRRAAAVGCMVTALLCGCGAEADSAPVVADKQACTSIDEHLRPLRERVAAGGLDQVALIINSELDRASLHAIVQLVLDVAQQLPAGTLDKAGELARHPQAARLVPIVVALLEPLPGDAKASPPVPAKSAELKAFSRIATTCLRAPLFAALTDVLRDERLGPALNNLLGSADAAVAARKALRRAGVQTKDGFVTLFQNLALSIAAPDFDPRPLVDLLDALAGQDTGLIAGGRDLFRLLTLAPDGSVAWSRVDAVSTAMVCFNSLDEDFILPAYWYDILLSPAVSQALKGPPGTPPLDTAPIVELARLGAYATDVLAQSEASRDALGQVLSLLLRPDLSIAAIPEVIGLLESDALPGLFALLADLATTPCLEEDG